MKTPDIERLEAHRRQHELEQEAIATAMSSEVRQQAQHDLAHKTAHEAHDEKHKAEGDAVHTALAAVDRERTIHVEAHDREHKGHGLVHEQEQKAVTTALAAVGRERDIHAEAHKREHELNQTAIEKAERANDARFMSVNGTRDQLNDLVRRLATKESVDALTADKTRRWEDLRKELDRRFDEQRSAITAIEKGDVKQEGKGIGQAWVFAGLATVISVVGVILGILIIVVNFATKSA